MAEYQDAQNRTFRVEALPEGKGFRVRLGEREVLVDAVERTPEGLRLHFGGRWYTVAVSVQSKERWLTWEGQTYRFTRRVARARRSEGQGGGDGLLRAPMPGQIRALKVQVGEQVTQGQTVLIMEAMKMEIQVKAPFTGTVTRLEVREGDVVEREALLGEVRPTSS